MHTNLEACGAFLYVLSVLEGDATRATPDACHATACNLLREDVRKEGGAVLFPTLRVEEEPTGARVCAHWTH